MLQQCQQMIQVSALVGLRLRPAVERPSRKALEDATLCIQGVSRENIMPSLVGSALHVMLFLENLIRALLIFNGLRGQDYQRALLVYHYPLVRGIG